jgi:preprotein translocase subunit SecY
MGVFALINFLKTSELKKRILNTIWYLALFRLGSYIVLPGLDVTVITRNNEGILGLLDLFVGGAFKQRSIFALGIMPYISASIVVHIMTLLFPAFQKIQQDGQAGRMKLNQITKIITLALAIFQNFVFLSSAIYDSELLIGRRNFLILSSIILTSGTMACVWIGERITDYGIGQGTSVLILVGIISSLPGAIYEEYNLKAGNEMVLFLEVGVLFFITMCVVALSLAIRKIKLQYIKDTMEYEDLQASREYLPIKVISAGVMPIIFGNVILFFVAFIFNLFSEKNETAMRIYNVLIDNTTWGYNILFSILIIIFTYLYTAININPHKIASDFKNKQCCIPRINPGTDTAEYIDKILNLVLLPGALCLAVIAFLPAIAYQCEVGRNMSRFFGGTSLLIAVPVAIEVWERIESYWILAKFSTIDSTDTFSK